ncbi:transketolase [Cryobacterium roopkundense]|uniref:Transketolase n=1 Tax=Cryobacterium roopkundense TaxID=1001240 RepID=A0A099J5T4_9MICO|nr:transketolase C-terminal domain-containing protein [Cryobacterium roopkundense]KGJ72818.1 transketolase [Cryobacterium roopkundense]MBB5642890.1 transketolase [Cryobacterium roopkundense]
MKAQRQVWGETLAELAQVDSRVVVLDADLATSTRADIVADKAPHAFIQIGIAEQNMVGMAFGMSTLGYRPWLSTFGVFLTHRALDQIRMLVSQTKAPVRIAAAYSGLLNGSSGKTHQDIEDLAIMRAMPNMTVLAPADEFEAAAIIRWAAEHDGPVYIRFARDAVRPVFDASYTFVPAQPVELLAGPDITLISTGVQTSRTFEAAQLLAADGIQAQLIHLPSIKPLDEAALLSTVGDAKHVITVEDHSRIGGLGGLIAEIAATAGSFRVTRIGLDDRWAESAPNDFLLDKYGLSPERVADSIRGALKQSG